MIFLVTNTSDSGAGSLRQAILNANASSEADTIQFSGSVFSDATPDTITLTTGELVLTDSFATLITNNGAGAAITINGGAVGRIIRVASGAEAELDGLTLTNGRAASGGAIQNAGTLVVTDSTISASRASVANGGGIENLGNLTVVNSTLQGNGATNSGGGISNTGTLTVVSSTLSGNSAGFGGAVLNASAGGATPNSVLILNSTLSGNTGVLGGAALRNNSGTVQVLNSTITNNTASGTTGSGLSNNTTTGARTEVGNTILSGNANSDVAVSGALTGVVSLGNNLVGTGTGAGAFTAAGDRTGITTPGLSPLANNGGSTQTHALIAGSLAINGGNNALLPEDEEDVDGDGNLTEVLPVDQRGSLRTSGGGVDVGAFELAFPLLSISSERVAQDEGNSGFTDFIYTLTLSQPALAAVQISLDITGGTADPTTDLIFTNSVGIPIGGTSTQVRVRVIGDTTIEANETFNYTITQVTNADSDPNASTVSGTILNDDVPTLSLTGNPLSQAEGNSGITPYLFTTTLSAATTQDVSVTLNITGGTAIVGSDIQAGYPTTLVIPAGSTRAQAIVNVLGDTDVELDETFNYGIVGVTNATVDPTAATVSSTIVNDDTPPPLPTLTLTTDTPAQTEGNSGNTPYEFTLTLSSAATEDVTVTLGIGGGTATIGSDLEAGYPTTVVMAAGSTSAQAIVNVVGDTAIEADETFVYTITDVTGGAVLAASSSVTATILNDDAFIPITLSGLKFNDQNQNGLWDAGEGGLENWTLFLDSNDNGLLDVGEVSTLSGADGTYRFTGLGAGVYQVREVQQPGFTQTTPDPAAIAASSGVDVANLNFGNAAASSAVVAVADTAIALGGASVSIDVLANDSTPLPIALVSAPGNGVAVLNTNGTADNIADDRLVYTPNPRFCGTDSFAYQLTDRVGNSSTATVTVSVLGAVLVGNALANTLIGGNCSDRLDGAAGNDTLIGVAGNDTLTGGTGADRFVIAVGSRGSNVITDFTGLGRGSWFQGSSGEVDTIQFLGVGAIAANLLAQQVEGDLLLQFEGVNETQVTLQNFQLENLENLSQGNGSNVSMGNILFYEQTTPQDSYDVYNADSLQSRIWNRNTVTFLNALNNEVLGYDNSNDVINAQGGDDQIRGLSGDDLLRGEVGNDALFGGGGDDTLVGGAGNDTLTGGSGNDVFGFRSEQAFALDNFGIDTVSDFVAGSDRIALALAAFSTLTSPLEGPLEAADFATVTSDAAAASSSAIIVYNTSNGVLSYNSNTTGSGFGVGGAIALLSGQPTLSAADFLVVA